MQPWKHSTKHLSDLLLFKHLLQEPQPTIRGKGTDFILYGTALYGELQQKKRYEIGHSRRALLQETEIACKWSNVCLCMYELETISSTYK